MDTRLESRVPITSAAMFELGQPKARGVFDANMGTTDSAYVCATCQMSKEKCHGHPGHFALNYPCLSPIVLSEIKKWLKIICFHCGNIILSDGEMRAILGQTRATNRLDFIVKHISNQARNCAACGRMHATVKRPDKVKYSFIVKNLTPDGTTIDIPLYPHNIAEIFERVRDETVARIGRSPLAHPRCFVIHCIYIPPPAIRPDSKKQGGRGSGNDSITSRLKDLIQFHTKKIKPSIPQEIDAKYAVVINTLNEMLADILTKGNDRSKSIAMRLNGKRGRLRENLLGKRAFGMGRSTIDGSPRLNLDQISIPLFIAQTLQIEETVQDFNRERLSVPFANGIARYPGCSRVIKRDGGVFKPDAPGLRLDNGDIIVRDLVNGDVVAFNRQPTLTLSNITSVRIVIDKTALANGMSALTCPFYNADFDGDQMNIFNYAKPASLNEQVMMTNVASRMVSATTGNMLIGQAGDSMIGLTKLTQSGVELDKYHAGLVFSSANCVPHLARADGVLISGREMITMVLAHTPISYRGKSAYYDANAQWMKWMPRSPNDAVIEIANGKLVRGCLDKPSIGPGASSIYQVMVREFGPQRTLDVIYDMQQIGINYMSQHGFTTGIHDFHIAPEERAKIARTSQGTLTKAYQIIDQLNHRQIIPPIDKTVWQYYEEKQINTQRVVDDYHEPVIRSIRNPRTNGVFELMASGCKGSPTFLVNMVATVGLIMISGERVRANFGYARTLPYFQRFEESPEARGYVGTSFMQGLSLVGCIFNAMMARTDIISRALMTSVTGDQNRKSIKSLESIITNNYRMTIKGHDIVSFVYGGDYYDPRYLEFVSYGPALLADVALERAYKFTAANALTKQGAFDGEFARILADRAEYRRIYKTIENLSVRDKMGATIKLPFSIARIAERIGVALAATGERADSDDAFISAIDAVEEFCRDAPYLFINEEQQRARAWVPAFIESAVTLIRMYVRAELCAAKLRALLVQVAPDVAPITFVRAILESVRIAVTTSLIDPGQAVGIIAAQSFSEPFTQDMLDSYKLSAITGGNVSRTKMSKCREVMNAYGVDRLSNPMMTIALESQYAASAERAQEVAQRLEMLKFSQLIAASQIFYERFGEPIHPRYAHERAIFATFAEDNPLMPPPGDLATWCMRFEIDKSALVQKNISMQTIITKLRDKYSDLHLVYTTERAREVIVRAYVRASGLARFSVQTDESDAQGTHRKGIRRARGHESRIKDVYDMILNTTIRGVDGIWIARVERLVRTKVDADGAIVDDSAQFGVRTNGTNLVRAACTTGVRADMVQTDAVQELASVLGIEAARYRIITEMRGLVEKCNVRHYMIYADEMTRTGRVTSIERGGLSVREVNNVALRAGQAAPVQVFTEAALNTRRDVLFGVSGPLTFGAVPRIGTLYNAFIIDPEVIKKYKKTAKQTLEDI
jgi:DNA-directed RNA polymerase beta' subunit